MTPIAPNPRPMRAVGICLLLMLAGGATNVAAQYKVVGPDGKVTYTDRPPASSDGKISALGARSPVVQSEPELPAELRQIVARYPVTLYTVVTACAPCELARQFLRHRGIPYSEKLAATPDDGDTLERLSGGRDAPTLTLGSQVLRGFSSDVWNSYLDAAGFPRESRLPSTYRHAATPMTPPKAVSAAQAAAPAPTTATPPEPAPLEPAGPPGVSIKF